MCVLSFSLSTVVVYEKSFTLRAFGGVFVATLYFETNTNASLSLSLSLSKTMNETKRNDFTLLAREPVANPGENARVGEIVPLVR